MNTDVVIKTIVGVIVAFVVIVMVAVPIIGGLQLGTTFNNDDDSPLYSHYSSDDSAEITISYSDSSWRINDTPLEGMNRVAAYGDTFILGSKNAGTLFYYDGSRENATEFNTDTTVTLTKGSLSTSGTTSISLQYSEIVVLDSEGNYAYCNGQSAYDFTTAPGNPVFIVPSTPMISVNALVSLGEVDISANGPEVMFYGAHTQNSGTVTTDMVDSLEMVGTQFTPNSDGTVDVSGSSLQTIFYYDDSGMVNAPSDILVPVSGTVITTSESNLNTVINMIPLLMMVGLLAMTVGAFLYYRS